MQHTTVFLLYKINQKSITEKYCINKNKKNSCCKGSCHLNSTLNKIDKEDSKNPLASLNFKIKEIELLLYKLPAIQFKNDIKTSKPVFANITSAICTGFIITPHQPPCFLGS